MESVFDLLHEGMSAIIGCIFLSLFVFMGNKYNIALKDYAKETSNQEVAYVSQNTSGNVLYNTMLTGEQLKVMLNRPLNKDIETIRFIIKDKQPSSFKRDNIKGAWILDTIKGKNFYVLRNKSELNISEI